MTIRYYLNLNISMEWNWFKNSENHNLNTFVNKGEYGGDRVSSEHDWWILFIHFTGKCYNIQGISKCFSVYIVLLVTGI